MEKKEKTFSVLLVSPNEKFHITIKGLFPKNLNNSIETANDLDAAKRKCSKAVFDIVIINVLNDYQTQIQFASKLIQNSNANILMLVKNEVYDPIGTDAANLGIMTLPKPASSTMITQALVLLCAANQRVNIKENEYNSTLEDTKIISRAKLLLIEELKMSEVNAHRYIEKQAMDRCVTKRAIAESIIKTYK